MYPPDADTASGLERLQENTNGLYQGSGVRWAKWQN